MVEEGSIRKGSFAGVPVIWNFTLLFIPAFLFLHLTGAMPVRLSLTIGLTLGAVASILLHEAGHVWTARRFGIPSEAILVHGFGGVALLSRRPWRRKDQILISLAGPAINLALAAVLYGVVAAVDMIDPAADAIRSGTVTPWRGAMMRALRTLALGNLLLGVVNLLPALPLDGGTIMRTLLARRFSELTAIRITAGLGVFFSLWLCMGVGAFGIAALGLGLLLAILNIRVLYGPDAFIDW